MKYAATALILATAAQAKQNPNSVTGDAVQVMEGVLFGALDAEFGNIEHCIEDGEDLIKDVETAWNDFKGKSATDIISGLKTVGTALLKVKDAVVDCKGIEGDFKKLAEMAVAFSNPESAVIHVGKDIIIHGISIWHEVSTAVKDLEETPKKYYDFGFNIGKAAAQIIIGEQGEIAYKHIRQKEVAEVLNGIMKNYGGNFNLENLLFCIYDEDQALLMLDASVQAFESAYEKKDIGDVIGGIIGLVGFVQQFKTGLPICEAIDTSTFDFKQFSDTIDIAAHPMEHFELLEDDIKMHGVSIMEDVQKAAIAYRHNKYDTFGEIMGKVLKLATQANADKLEVKADSWKSTYPKENREMMTEIFQGLFESTGVGSFNFTNLLLCVYEADQSALELYQGVQLLEQSWNDTDLMPKLIDGFGGLTFSFLAAQSFKQNALPLCEQIDKSTLNFKQFDNIYNVLENHNISPEVIGENLVFNGATITAEYVQALTAFNAGDYKLFGQVLGQTLNTAIGQDKNMYLY